VWKINVILEWTVMIKLIMCLKNDKEYVGEHIQIKVNSCRGMKLLIFAKWLHISSAEKS